MEDYKELVVIKILSELQEKYDINNVDVKNILDRNLDKYTLVSNETSLMASDIKEKTCFFICLKRLEGLAETSIQSYLDELNMFSRYIIKPVNQISINDLRSYLGTIQQEKKYENTTINNKISILKTFFGTLYKEEVILKDPTLKLKKLKVNNRDLREHLTVEELEVLRNSCKDIREKSIIEFFISTGCRISEVLKIDISNIDWNNNSIVVNGKGNKNRTVYFSVKCKLYLQEYLKSRNRNNESLFIGERSPYNKLTKSGIEKIFKKISSRTSIKKDVSPHVMRHTYATLALQRGMDMVTIQHLLGHKSVSTTQIYARTNEKQLQIAYEKYIAA